MEKWMGKDGGGRKKRENSSHDKYFRVKFSYGTIIYQTYISYFLDFVSFSLSYIFFFFSGTQWGRREDDSARRGQRKEYNLFIEDS